MALKRKIAAGTAAVLAGVALPLFGQTTAQATSLNTCAGSETATYTPPLRATPTSTSVVATGSLTCTGDTNHPSATVEFDGAGTLSCLTGGTTQGTGELRWPASATTSGFTFSLAEGTRPLGEEVLVATGTITSGDYQGQSVLFTFTLLSTDPASCTTTGVASDSGPLTITIGV